MNKWYNEDPHDESVIISSRIRLARNLKKYPFAMKIDLEQSKSMIKDVCGAVINNNVSRAEFDYVDFNNNSSIEKLVLLEDHAISRNFLMSKAQKGLLLKKDEKVSIMINEEDHIRLQSISYGDDIDNAYELANKMDNLIEESVEYAFNKDFGYLTSCLTNVGTGLRASYMIHIPMLSQTKQISNLISAINKFGMTIRGIYGEGAEPSGHIYQISNQITLGKSEDDIINNFKQITNQLIGNENYLRRQALEINRIEWEDTAYRSYGILKNAKKISINESMNLLSNIRLGFMMGILDIPRPKTNIYNIMMNSRSGNLQFSENRALSEPERDICRADYLRSMLD